MRDSDTIVYLFGTVHVLKPGLSWFDEAVKQAFDRSDTLVLELVQPPPAEMQAIIAELGAAAPGEGAAARLPPPARARLRAALRSHGYPETALDAQAPWLAATTVAMLPLQKAGYDPDRGAEAVLTRAARAAGKRIAGLESARRQLGYFHALSPGAQRALLIDTLDGLAQADAAMARTVDAWGRGDPDALAALLNRDLAGADELRQTLLVARNRRWAEWVARQMDRPGIVFVAVGAGHLAGADSVQAELARRGLRAERIAY